MRSFLTKALLVFIIIILFGVAFLAVKMRGTFRGKKNQPVPLNINLQDIKPDIWKAERPLEPVNIDRDPESEWLLIYRYDNGLLGGVIYDAQTTPRGDVKVPIPDRPSAYLVPYRLLPDYLPNHKTNGYLGDDDIDYKLTRSEGAEKTDRLQVIGIVNDKRVTRFSVFWWLDEQHGYGGTHISTPGWLSLSGSELNDWQKWQAKDVPNVTTVWSWEPLADRSDLCRRTKWQRQELTPKEKAHPPTDKTAFDRREKHRQFLAEPAIDLTFCNGTPGEPAFPEGQVLAYLLDGNKKRLADPARQQIPLFQDVVLHYIRYPAELDGASTPEQPIVVTVDTDFTEGPADHRLLRRLTWYVEMRPPAKIKDTVHWRITNVAAR